jgi:hypothetical protein
LGWRGEDAYSHSIIADANVTDNLSYVFLSDYLHVDETGEDNFSIVNYLFYTINDCTKLGGRAEWWKTDPLTPGFGDFSVYATTFGVNYRPMANVVFRPEIRQQWSPAIDEDQTIFGVDMITTY